jgi:hypothetical protein
MPCGFLSRQRHSVNFREIINAEGVIGGDSFIAADEIFPTQEAPSSVIAASTRIETSRGRKNSGRSG